MRQIKVIERRSVDTPPKPYWIIEETVTPAGHTIQWPGIYSSEEAALEEVGQADKPIN